MATFVYRRASSSGARALAEALGAIRYKALNVPIDRKARQGDTIICWGETVGAIPGVRILNNAPINNKFTDATTLKAKGVPTVEVSRQKPAPQVPLPVQDPALPGFTRVLELANELTNINPNQARSPVTRQGLEQFLVELQNQIGRLNIPAPLPVTPTPVGEWLPRMNSHVGGDDLLDPPDEPDFYSKKVALVKEFRVHSFDKKSIRAGIKEPREGFTNPHPWIRSWDGGWRIKYDGVSSKQKHREIAHAAVEALGLTFGAVDIGELADGSLIVLEVNRAPGLEGGTIDAYAEAIQRYLRG